MMLTARMMIALFRSEDADLSYLQQALATVYAQKGEQADAYLEGVLTKVSKKRADMVRTLAVQVRAQRSKLRLQPDRT
jgi:predicted RNA-binding protein with PIN domain